MGYLSNRTKMVSIRRVFDGIEEFWGGKDRWLADLEHPDVRIMPRTKAHQLSRVFMLGEVKFVQRPYTYVFIKEGDDWVVIDPLLCGHSTVKVEVGYGEGYYIEGFNSQPQKLVINHAAGVYHEITFQNGKILEVNHVVEGETWPSQMFYIPDGSPALRFFNVTGRISDVELP